MSPAASDSDPNRDCWSKPKQQRAVIEHNYEWFSKYIWGEETASGAAQQ
jgi:hypothetical protein